MMSDHRNLIAAIVVSLAILLGFQFVAPELFPQFFAPRQVEREQATATTEPLQQTPQPGVVPAPGAPAPGVPAQVAPPGPPASTEAQVQAAVETAARLPIESPRLRGSIALTGGRIDDLTLTDYKVTPEPGSPNIRLLSPPGSPSPYYATYGWTAEQADLATPGPDTVWRADAAVLRPGQPVTLSWDNGAGLRFEQVYDLDKDYLLTVTQRVRNDSGQPVGLYAYGLISRTDTPQTQGFYILHEGPLGVFGGSLKELDYDDLRDESQIQQSSTGGWIGITDKYWLTALIPEPTAGFTGTFRHWQAENRDKYQVDVLQAVGAVPAGGTAAVTSRLFAGAKEVKLLDRYEEAHGIPLFDRAVDFGWFYFLTKPLFHVLHFFYELLGNFGLAILALTVCVKLIFFPLANKSYQAMSKMKALQPEMLRLRERYGDDRQKMNQELMALYRKEKVNPASGCLPILIQIPVFFALYKVLFVTIEMRHAPFFGWIRDLSAPDPLNIFTLFGLLPWNTPDFMVIGIWPILMGLSMWMQQKLNPAPADPIQARIFMLMPIFFTLLLGSFPAGLVIYWTWNNILSIAQQWLIMRRMGVPVGFSLKRST